MPVYAIRGMIYHDGGKPVNANVSLVLSEVLDMPERQVQARDGAFEFPDVPCGDWRVSLKATRRRLASIATKVQVDSGRVAYVELKPLSWPD